MLIYVCFYSYKNDDTKSQHQIDNSELQKTIIAPYHAIKYSRYSCDLTIIKIQLLHHVLQFDIQILLSVTVNNQKLTEGLRGGQYPSIEMLSHLKRRLM